MRSALISVATLATLGLAACPPITRGPSASQGTPSTARPPEAWAEEIARFEEADRHTPPRPGGVLFIGSSSIRLWPALKADFPGVDLLQRGFGGSELSDVVHYSRRIVLPYRPRLIVLYAGDNDLAAGKSPEAVFQEYRAFVAFVRQTLPETRIAFIAIKPSGARWGLVEQMRAANTLVSRYVATDPRLLFVDVFTPMLGTDGMPREELFAPDRLHMNTRGYALWRDLLAPVLRHMAR
ncbi:MAG: SGNH/GDSL hydrolase family protein [Gemmatimonadaceae bacterium]